MKQKKQLVSSNSKKILMFFFFIFITAVLMNFVIKLMLFPALSLITGTATPLMIVESDSLAPIYNSGDILLNVFTDDINIGDVVVFDFCVEDFCATGISRVTGISDDVYSLQGDNNNGQFEYERFVDADQIRGKVTTKITPTIVDMFYVLYFAVIAIVSYIFTRLYFKRLQQR